MYYFSQCEIFHFQLPVLMKKIKLLPVNDEKFKITYLHNDDLIQNLGLGVPSQFVGQLHSQNPGKGAHLFYGAIWEKKAIKINK